jgi:hypothetical protein
MNRDFNRHLRFLLCERDCAIVEIDTLPLEPGQVAETASRVVAGENQALPITPRRIYQLQDLIRSRPPLCS